VTEANTIMDPRVTGAFGKDEEMGDKRGSAMAGAKTMV